MQPYKELMISADQGQIDNYLAILLAMVTDFRSFLIGIFSPTPGNLASDKQTS